MQALVLETVPKTAALMAIQDKLFPASNKYNDAMAAVVFCNFSRLNVVAQTAEPWLGALFSPAPYG
jgi:hypothetical protein